MAIKEWVEKFASSPLMQQHAASHVAGLLNASTALKTANVVCSQIQETLGDKIKNPWTHESKFVGMLYCMLQNIRSSAPTDRPAVIRAPVLGNSPPLSNFKAPTWSNNWIVPCHAELIDPVERKWEKRLGRASILSGEETAKWLHEDSLTAESIEEVRQGKRAARMHLGPKRSKTYALTDSDHALVGNAALADDLVVLGPTELNMAEEALLLAVAVGHARKSIIVYYEYIVIKAVVAGIRVEQEEEFRPMGDHIKR